MAKAIPLGKAGVVAATPKSATAVPLFDKEPVPFKHTADIPEITSQEEIPWHNRLAADAKLLMTSDPWEKARIIIKSFPKRTELMVDTETNQPIVSIDGNPYMINKVGLSAQDINDLTAETGSYIIPSLLSGGASLLARLGLGALTYGATEAVREAGTYVAGGKKADAGIIDFSDVGTVGGVGAVAEAFLPPIMKIGGRAVRKLWSSARPMSEDVLTAVITAASTGDDRGLREAMKMAKGSDTGKIPLTRGQSTGSRADLETEAMMREGTGAYGEAAHDVIKQADAAQMGRIISEAEGVQSRVAAGGGFAPDAPTTIGSRLQSDLIQEEAKRKAVASAAQTAAKAAVVEKPAYVAGEAMKDGISRILSAAKDRGIGAQMLNTMVYAPKVIQTVKTLQKAMERGRITKGHYGAIVDFRKRLGGNINQAGAHTEEGALLIDMKSRLDDMVDTALTKGLIDGDAATIGLIKDANKLWSQYKKDFFKARPDRFSNTDMAGKRIQEVLGNETPERVVNFFANVSKNAPKKETGELFIRMQRIFGKESEQIQLIKDAVVYRLFTNATRRGSADITRTDIVKNYTDFFQKNSSLANLMFNSAERSQIRKFVGNVARTMPAEQMINPSGTGRFLARFFNDMTGGGITARISSMVRGVPIVGDAGGAGYARALAYMDRLTSAPLGAVSVASVRKGEDSTSRQMLERAAQGISEFLEE
jgi:hypothetical protein